MRPIGFSTGAIARGDFRLAVQRMRDCGLDVIELSALRIGELAPLLRALPTIDLAAFQFVSIHAPSRFEQSVDRRWSTNSRIMRKSCRWWCIRM